MIVTVDDFGGSRTVVHGAATVTDLPVTGDGVTAFRRVEDQNTGTIVLATFEDPNSLGHAGYNVTATLPVGGWGDGTPTVVTPLAVTRLAPIRANDAPIFEVLSNHPYKRGRAASPSTST